MSHEDLIGRTLGHYEITERLGRGGMGEVYSATDTRLNRSVALKVLPPELAGDPERLQRFEREARTVAALSHPNIVTIYSVEQAGDLHFLTMERVSGRTLDQLIDEGGMPLDRFFDIAVPLAEAVRSAHDRGVSHRDLKPSNVMVDDEGHVKVLDFGLAKMTQSASPDGLSHMATSDLTREGRIVGTVAYMSPEQAEGKPLDHRTDIFSLGILLYEMLAGERPFGGDTNIAVLSSILKDKPRPLAELRRDLPASLSRIADRALHKLPGDRYSSARELRDDLAALRRDLDSGDLARTSGPHERPAPIDATRWRRVMTFGIGGAVMAAVIVAVSLVALRPPAEPGPAASTAAEGTVAAVNDRVDERPTVAVLYFDNLSGAPELDWLRAGLADMLITDLSESAELRVLGTDRLYQILEDLGHLDDTTTRFEVVAAVAEAAGARRAVVGSFLQAGETLRISARLQDAATGDVLISETVEGDGEEALFDLVDQLSERLRARLLGTELPDSLVADATMADDVPADDGGAGEAAPVAPPAAGATVEAVPATPGPPPAEATAPVEATSTRTIRQVTTASVDAFRNYTMALKAADQVGPEAAIPLLEQALVDDPDFALAFARLSDLHATMGDEEMSIAYAREALDRRQRLPSRDQMYLEGRTADDVEASSDNSLKLYRQTLERFPDHAAARGELTVRLYEDAKFDEAMRQIEEMSQLGMDPTRTNERLAHIILGPGSRAESRERLGDLVAAQPENVALQCTLAEVAAADGDAAAAMRALDAARRLAPEDLGVRSTAWRVPALLGQLDRAREAAAALATTGDSEARYRSALAMATLAQLEGNVSDALDWFDRAAAIAPAGGAGAWKATIESIRLLLAVPDGDRAAERIERAMRAGPTPPQRVFLTGAGAVAAALRGEDAEARRLERTFEEMSRRGPQPPAARSRSLAELGAAIAMARGDASKALELMDAPAPMRGGQPPDFGDPRYLTARARLELGRPQDAEPLLRAIVEDGPARLQSPLPYVRSLYDLGQLARDAGDRAAARQYFTRYVESWDNGELDRPRVSEASAYLRSTPDRN